MSSTLIVVLAATIACAGFTWLLPALPPTTTTNPLLAVSWPHGGMHQPMPEEEPHVGSESN